MVSTKSKQVLIIAPTFAPQNFVNMYRTYRLAKYLPRYGWSPHVLTIDVNYNNPEDPTLLESLPDEMRIHTAKYVEPSVRGLQMAFGGPDRTTPTMQREAAQGVSSATGPAVAEHVKRVRPVADVYAKLFTYTQRRWLSNPDNYATWYRPGLRKARQLVREFDIPLVVTTMPEYTGPRIGAALKADGVPWIADFQDPPSYMDFLHSRLEPVFLRQRRIEQAAVAHADAITVAATGIRSILHDMHAPKQDRIIEFIPWGIDEELLDSEPAQLPHPYLLFVGGMTKEYGPEFLEAFATALENPDVRSTGVRFMVVGPLQKNSELLMPLAQRLGIEDSMVLVDTLPQREVFSLLAGAKAGVLLTGRIARWWCLNAKLVEYMGMRKRVVAVVPELSESRMHLERTGLGVFLDGDRQQSAQTLADFILDRLALPDVNETECNRFTASRQAEDFGQLFERVLSDSRDGGS